MSAACQAFAKSAVRSDRAARVESVSQTAIDSYIRRPFERYVPADRMSAVMNANTASSGGAQSKAPCSSSVQPSSDMFDA